jgi:hypothetical protein
VNGLSTLSGALSGTSATFSGDLTIDTNTLYVDSTNNRVGIGTTNPTRQFEIYNSTDAIMRFNGARVGNSIMSVGTESAGFVVYDDTNSAYRLVVKQTGQVVIGNTTAESKLQIYGGQDLGTGVDGYGQFKIRNSDFGTRLAIHLRADDPNLNDIVEFKAFSNNGSIAKFSFNGNIGIGINSGTGKLYVKQSTTNFYDGLNVYSSSNTAFVGIGHTGTLAVVNSSYNTASSYYPLAFFTSDIERMRILANGNIGIGTTSPSYALDVSGNVAATRFWVASGGNATDPMIRVKDDTDTGIFFPAANEMAFSVAASEQMRIVNGGILLNTTNILTAGYLCISVPSNNYNAIVLRDSGTTYTSANYYQVFTNSTNTIAGSISHNTATTIGFNTSSDYRLKEDFKDFNGLDILSNIKFYDFKWKEENKRMHGVIAHELEPLLPLAVSGLKDAIDEEGNIVAQGVDYSKLVPILGKAIQELKAEIEELKALINK